MVSKPDDPVGVPRRPDVATPGAVERGQALGRALAAYAGLAPDHPALPALVCIVEGLILPGLDVLEHGYGRIEIAIAGQWPQLIARTKSDRCDPPPREHRGR